MSFQQKCPCPHAAALPLPCLAALNVEDEDTPDEDETPQDSPSFDQVPRTVADPVSLEFKRPSLFKHCIPYDIQKLQLLGRTNRASKRNPAKFSNPDNMPKNK